jgi:hypothetical protein
MVSGFVFISLLEESLCHCIPATNTKFDKQIPIGYFYSALRFPSKTKVTNDIAFTWSLHAQAGIEVTVY